MAAPILPLRTANRLRNLYERLQAANQAWMDGRAIALEMVGLDPEDLQIGIDFTTGMVSLPPPVSLLKPVAVEGVTDAPPLAETVTENPA